MECGICDRCFDKARKPVCVSCAHAALYEPRIRQISGLLDRENAHTHTEAIVRPGNDGVLAALPQDADWDAITSAVKKHSSERAQAEQLRVEIRIAAVAEQVDLLRSQIEDHRRYIEDATQKNRSRREGIAKERNELARRKPLASDPVQVARQKAARRLDKVHGKTMEDRAYLCRHSSSLNGIHQLRDGRGNHTGRFQLNGLTLPNLKELSSAGNSASLQGDKTTDNLSIDHHANINACLDNVCHLVGVWCHYLSLRLPAEIILPHIDFPHSAILSERSSYKTTNLPYPVSLASHPSSPSASRLLQEQRNLPRPRLLHLDRPLARLAKEDQKTFALFVEGAMLLAWDIAWLCRTQGITTVNSFDDVCDIGRNIWLLAHAQQFSGNDRDRRDRATSEGIARLRKPAAEQSRFGSFSHGTLRHSIAGNEGATLMQEWRLSQPHRLIDKLKSHLLIEITGAEWDVLDEDDFDDEREDEQAVLVGGTQRKALESKHPAMSVMSVAPREEPGTRPKGESGWMKVRGRGGEV